MNFRTHFKIIHTTCHDQWGGLEKRIFNESVWMAERGHNVIIAAPENCPLYQNARDHGFKTFGVKFKKRSMLKDYQFLKRMFSNEMPDIVNTHGNSDSKVALYAAYKAGIQCRILSRHVSAHVTSAFHNKYLYKKLASYVFTTADYTTNHLKSVFHLTGKQICSVPSGIIPPENLVDKNNARQDLSNALGLPEDTRFLGFIGRVSHAKGADTILNAFKLLADDLPGYHLVYIGDSSLQYFNYIKELAEKMKIADRVHTTGPKKDIWKYYRAFDCKLLASRGKKGIPFEGVPQAVLEAMYCKCPVVGARSGGIPDIIEHEKTGYLFDSENPEELAQMVLKTLNRPGKTKEQVRTAFEKVKKHHTIDAMGRNILRIYKLHQLGLTDHKPVRI